MKIWETVINPEEIDESKCYWEHDGNPKTIFSPTGLHNRQLSFHIPLREMNTKRCALYRQQANGACPKP